MSEAPWFKFYSSDWLVSAAGLSAAERGVYITLLALMYEHDGDLIRDDARLARQCGLPKAGFTRALESLIAAKKIIDVDGSLSNERAKNELTARESRIGAASKSAKSRWNKINGNQCKIDAVASPERCVRNANTEGGIQNTDIPPSSEGGIAPPHEKSVFEIECRRLADGMPIATAQDFHAIQALRDDPSIKDQDIFEGIAEAKAKNFKAKSWVKLAGWSRTAAQRRIERKAQGSPQGQGKTTVLTQLFNEGMAYYERQFDDANQPHSPAFIDAAANTDLRSFGCDSTGCNGFDTRKPRRSLEIAGLSCAG